MTLHTHDTHRLPPWRAAVLGAGLAVALVAGIAIGRATADPVIAVPGELQRADLQQPFADFFQAYHVVTTDSYYAPLPDRKRLIYAAINGMLTGGTGDPHTLFVSPEDNTAVQNALNGSFEGIGAYVDATPRGLAIIPLPGSPAQRAGLHAGDVVVRVDGRDVTADTEDQVVALLRGRAGTRVTLGVQRASMHGLLTVSITRGHITVPTVSVRMIGRMAYLRLTEFATNSGPEVRAALRSLMSHHPRGLVLDLRDNPGGYVTTAVDVNSEFLSKGQLILWEQNNRHQLGAPLRSTGGGLATRVPMVVLVNDGTASAAEITAGALHDDGRARVVGITTYGKGSVQQVYALPDNSSLRVTIRLWLTPRKSLIQSRGIVPDVVMDSTVSDGSARDTQLSRALRLLTTGR